ncbi:MAG TPA: BON domain-containing protein [Lysobacter sp.]
MNRVLKIAVAFAAGAAVMYYFDPIAGRRRRALARDKRHAAVHELEAFAARARHAADRMHGAAARRRDAMSMDPLDDDVLHERIRSKLGRVVERSGQVEVHVRDGHVLLNGHAHADEIDEVIDVVSAMRGVVDVVSLLTPPGTTDEVSDSMAQDARH